MANYDDHREAPYQRTTESFVYKSKLKHGDFYDYSKVEYTHSRSPVVIGCPTHGDFLQKPVHHQLGRGCQKCAKEVTSSKRTFSNGEFIRKANIKHNFYYDYSVTKYRHSQEKVRIRCVKHGIFEQLPNSHLRGSGCAKCNNMKASIDKMMTIRDFVSRSIMAHGDIYDYSDTVFNGTRNKLYIKCKIHGVFSQYASVHLQGKGCPKCGLERMSYSQESFLAKCCEVHGSRYDYSNTIYKRSSEKVEIKCSKHGKFKQNAACHMSGQGCAKCAQEENDWSRSRHTKAAERNNHSIIYLIECFSESERFYKVGITTHKINRRFNGKDCMPYAFNVLCTKSDGAHQDWDNEKLIHRKLKKFKYTPLINFKGDGECFSELTQEVKDFFGVKK